MPRKKARSGREASQSLEEIDMDESSEHGGRAGEAFCQAPFVPELAVA